MVCLKLLSKFTQLPGRYHFCINVKQETVVSVAQTAIIFNLDLAAVLITYFLC